MNVRVILTATDGTTYERRYLGSSDVGWVVNDMLDTCTNGPDEVEAVAVVVER